MARARLLSLSPAALANKNQSVTGAAGVPVNTPKKRPGTASVHNKKGHNVLVAGDDEQMPQTLVFAEPTQKKQRRMATVYPDHTAEILSDQIGPDDDGDGHNCSGETEAQDAQGGSKQAEDQEGLQQHEPIGEEAEGEFVDEDPDWDAIVKHHPASKDVPVFLEARERRRKLDEQFTERLNAWSEAMHTGIDTIWNVMVDIHQTRSDKLNELEEMLKTSFVNNEITRAEMERKLEASTREVQSLYASLMMQICQPLGSMTNAVAAEAMNATETNGC